MIHQIQFGLKTAGRKDLTPAVTRQTPRFASSAASEPTNPEGDNSSPGVILDLSGQAKDVFPSVSVSWEKERELLPQIKAGAEADFKALLAGSSTTVPMDVTSKMGVGRHYRPQITVTVDEDKIQDAYTVLRSLPGVAPLYTHPDISTLGPNKNNTRRFLWQYKALPEILVGQVWQTKTPTGAWTNPREMSAVELKANSPNYPIMVHLKDKNDDQKRVTAFNELAALISNAKTKVKGAQNITLTPTLVEGNSGEQEVFIYTSAKEAKLANKVLNLGLPGYRERHVISRLGWFSKPRWLFNLQRKLQPNTPVSGVIDIRIPSLLMRNSSTLREWMDRRNGINHVLDYTSKKVPGYTLRVNIRDQGLQLLGG